LKGEIILGFRVNVQILENETITEENYKKWPDEAIWIWDQSWIKYVEFKKST
jgi:hypothetical protein